VKSGLVELYEATASKNREEVASEFIALVRSRLDSRYVQELDI
jgi:hypothetical protein